MLFKNTEEFHKNAESTFQKSECEIGHNSLINIESDRSLYGQGYEKNCI